MIDVSYYIIAVLKADTTLTAIVPATSISAGPVDIAQEAQATLRMPQINLAMIAETSRTVPLGARDIVMQLDIWDRNSQLELETIYEEVLNVLNFVTANENSTHIYWERSEGAVDQYEADRRIWHRSVRFVIWAGP